MAATASSGVATLRVATWNLRHGHGADLAVIASRIAALDADVVAVQEVDRRHDRSAGADQVADLARLLGWHGLFAPTMIGHPPAARPASPTSRDDGVPAYGIGLLSRRPLTAATTTVLPPAAPTGRRAGLDAETRVALSATSSTEAGPVMITVTHLSWQPATAWRQLRTVLSTAAARPGPAIIAGDLNLPRWYVRAALRGTGWHAAHAGPTFPGRRPLMQLDHILVRGGRTLSATTGPADPSDHRPLGVTVVTGLVAPRTRRGTASGQLTSRVCQASPAGTS